MVKILRYIWKHKLWWLYPLIYLIITIVFLSLLGPTCPEGTMRMCI